MASGNKSSYPQGSIPEIAWLEKIAVLLDNQFQLPGSNFKFGLDPLIGLIPIAGNVVTMFISACLMLIMTRYGASRKVVLLMTLNILIDTIVGGIPVLGNIFDFGFKSNLKNIRLLKAHYYEGRHQGSGTGIVLVIVLLFFAISFALVFGLYKLFVFFIGLFHHSSW